MRRTHVDIHSHRVIKHLIAGTAKLEKVDEKKIVVDC